MSATGAKTVSVYTANYDGKPYPITGSEIADTVTLKRVDAQTSERTDRKGGQAVLRFIGVVSKDGKTMTVTIKGTNAQGQAVNKRGRLREALTGDLAAARGLNAGRSYQQLSS